MFNKTFLKFLAGGLAVVFLGVGASYGLMYYSYRVSPEYRAMKYFEDLEKKYREDTYGGETPEETLQLFVEALKAGDIELASKYFLIEVQEKYKEWLRGIKEKGLIGTLVDELEKTSLKVDDETAFFTLVRDDGFSSQLVMHKNSLTGLWKITEL